MRALLTVLALVALTGVASADKPVQEVDQPTPVRCELTCIMYDWDFANDSHGFDPAICEDGGMAVWEYGTSNIAGAPGDVWGTVLMDDYVNNSGDGLIAPSFTVTASSNMIEVDHYFDIETNFDGGNVTVNGTVVTPESGYTATISTSTSYYAYCVDLEDGFTGHDAMWRTDCFDISEWMGQDVVVAFDFGSDSSVTYPGWYLAAVRVGGEGMTPTESATWSHIKSMFE